MKQDFETEFVNKIVCGDCLELMADMPDNCIDTIITDPPYSLGFMGKAWDTFDKSQFGRMGQEGENDLKVKKNFKILPRHENWQGYYGFMLDVSGEMLRIAKPGAILMAFGGTRTFHRLACAIEDAGWQIRDTMMWLYSTGFPKSHNFGCKCRGNALPYTNDEKTKYSVRPLRKTDISSGEYAKEESGQVLFNGLPEQNLQELRPKGAKPQTGRQEQSSLEGRQLCGTGQGVSDGAKSDTPKGQSKRLRSGTSSGCGDNVGTATKTKRGSSPPQREQAGQSPEQPANLRQPQRALGGGASGNGSRCPTCGGLTKYAGWGTSLKPAFEPIIVAMKPLDGTFAQNAEKWGVAGLWIDGGRVGTEIRENQQKDTSAWHGNNWSAKPQKNSGESKQVQGRWPANVIHDGSDEVLAGFPESKSSVFNAKKPNNPATSWAMDSQGYAPQGGFADSGSAARFFYTAKASRAERNAGLEGMEERHSDGKQSMPTNQRCAVCRGWKTTGNVEKRCKCERPDYKNIPAQNNHPTVKPVSLMKYLCKLTKTPTGGLVFDPFAGSGTTGVACVNTGRDYLLCEKDEHYCEIAERRIDHAQQAGQMALFEQGC